MDVERTMEWISGDAAEMVELLREAEPDQPVPACPGWNAIDLGRHVAVGFAGWYSYNISTRFGDWSTDGLYATFPQLSDDHLANVDAFEAGVGGFIGLCSGLDLDQPTWSFGRVAPARWWIRRSAVELTVHLTDAASVHGRTSSTRPEFHGEAIDELTTEMMPILGPLKQVMNQLTGDWRGDPPPIPDRSAALVADDIDRAWTLARAADGSAAPYAGIDDDVAATGSGSAADVLAWLHGRPMTAPLSIEGDPQLVHDWNLFERAQE